MKQSHFVLIILWSALILIVYFLLCHFQLQINPFHFTGIIILAFCCELVDSGLGMGYGTTLTPILLTIGWEPLQIVPTVLVSEFLSGITAACFHNRAGNVSFSTKSPHFKVAILLSAGSIVGVYLGVTLALETSAFYLKLIIGIIITLSGVSILRFLHHKFQYRTWKMLVLSSVASFNKALSGGGYGPIVTSGQIFGGVESKPAVAITSFAEAFTCLAGVTLFMMKGQEITATLLIPICTGALLSVPLSVNFVRIMPEIHLKRIIAVFTILLGLYTLAKVLL